MSNEGSENKTERRTHKHKHTSSKRVSRTLTFVLTPFLMLIIVLGVTVLALYKPYTIIKPYADLMFNATSQETKSLRTLNKYRDDDAPVQSKEVSDDEGETHTMIYPYYGDLYATLNCESAGLNDVPVYSGITDDVLANGAGWYNGSVYIGHTGNVVIAGHNHTYFYNLPKCKEGDIVTLETSYVKQTYVVKETVVFQEDDYTYINPTDDDRLTMYTCWNNGKLGMSKYRIAIICELTDREWKEVEE
jgi:sortase A